jgi:hypothetical protein
LENYEEITKPKKVYAGQNGQATTYLIEDAKLQGAINEIASLKQIHNSLLLFGQKLSSKISHHNNIVKLDVGFLVDVMKEKDAEIARLRYEIADRQKVATVLQGSSDKPDLSNEQISEKHVGSDFQNQTDHTPGNEDPSDYELDAPSDYGLDALLKDLPDNLDPELFQNS